ncbi:cytochrome c6, chloroplastic isoform X1 [Prosopis cineraria]|uniref:cytochrome c6, chloroplastic isoform X1 n=1 Tax=Prosopis cineraria TaxID=364024 RepID=UPI0024103713|nr:cytochrome c6, chloroplastic isoform X1 [Prosopis cineraria]
MMQLASLISSCSNYTHPLSIKGEQNLIPVKAENVKFSFKSLAPPLMAALVALSPLCYTPDITLVLKQQNHAVCTLADFFNATVSNGQTIDIQRGASLFRQACIGCHDAGGNIIQPGATLSIKDLQRNGVDTAEGIYRITYYGKGRMPGFGKECMPRGQCTFGARLDDEDIKVLAEFVKMQADQGWPTIQNPQD